MLTIESPVAQWFKSVRLDTEGRGFESHLELGFFSESHLDAKIIIIIIIIINNNNNNNNDNNNNNKKPPLSRSKNLISTQGA